MIKALTKYDFTEKTHVPTGSIEAKSKYKKGWYRLDSNHFRWSWNNPVHPLLALTCLSTWSK